MKILFAICFILTAQVSPSLVTSPTGVRQASTYTFSFLINSATPSSSLVKIKFPSDFSIPDSNPYNCVLSNPSSQPTSYSCSSSESTVTVNGLFSTGDVPAGSGHTFTIVLSPINNPISTKPTESIIISTVASGSVIDTDSSLSVSATAATIASSSMSSSSQLIGGSASYTFSYTPTYSTPSGCAILVVFPFWNLNMNATSTSSFYKQMISGTITCTAVTLISSSLTCSYSTAVTDKTLIVTIANGFTSNTSGNVTFTISPVLNPPNSLALSGFVIYLTDGAGNDYEISNTMSIQVKTPNVITLSTSSIAASSQTVSTSVTFTFGFLIKNPMTTGYLIYITLPSELSIGTGMAVIGKQTVQLATLTSTTLGNQIKITNGFTGYSSGTNIQLQVTAITTPSSTKTSSTFTFSTATPDGNLIDTVTGGSFTATPGVISINGANPYITADNYVVGASTNYYIEFLISHSLPAGAALIIIFPPEVTPSARTSSTACSYFITSISTSATCGITGQLLTVTGGFPNGLTLNSAIKFGVNLITNSGSASTSSSFNITTYTSSALLYQIDTIASGVTITCISSSLASVTITSSSYITGDTVTYDFSIGTQTTVPTGGSLIVNFPTGISIINTLSAATSCTKLQGFTTSSFVCVVTASSITINGFSAGSFSKGTLEFTIGYVMNPISTKPVTSFNITTTDKNGYAIDQTSTGVTITMTIANILNSASVSMVSPVNGDLTTYTFSVIPKNTTPINSLLKIVPPSTVVFPSSPSCSSISSNINSLSCSITSTTNLLVTLSLSAPATSSTTIIFSVSNVKNPPSTQTTNTFMLYTYTSDNYGIDKQETGLTVTTTTAGTITSISVTAADTKISVSTSYTITYTPINVHPVGTIVTIIVPSGFTLGTISCSSTVLTITCGASGNTIVTSTFNQAISSSGNVILTISGITNPGSLITTAAWSISSKTGSYYIDSSNSIKSTFTCSNPCLTCSISASNCISCLSTGSTPYLYNNTCNSNCPAGQVDDITTPAVVCVNCNSVCLTCQSTPSNCISCATGAYPYLYNNTCNSGCPSLYYGNGTNCLACVNPCFTCLSSTQCSSCTKATSGPSLGSLTYLYNGTCTVTCPNGYLANSNTLTCDSCASTCLTCLGTTSSCASCGSPSVLLGSACVSSCPSDGTYIVSGQVCLGCSSPCYQCTTTTTTCTSCISGYVLSGSTCLSYCPPGTVNITNVCTACKSPCNTCSSSTLLCTSCITNYLLFSTTCLVNCPTGYVSDGINCIACNSTCYTCSGAANLCTSCTNGLSLLSFSCLASCPANTYISIANVCQPCSSNCSTCSTNTNFCKSCPAGYRLYNNVCIASCPVGTTIDTGTSCLDCSGNCATCSGTINTCVTCPNNYYLQNSACVDSCSAGYLFISNACAACNPTCFSCSVTSNNCTSCISNYYMLNTQCVSSCPTNYIISSGSCVQLVKTLCNTGCTDSLLYNNQCDQVCNVAACQYDMGNCTGPTVCLDGQYQNNSVCVSCSSPCNKCTAPNTCLTCQIDSSGYQWLFDSSTSYCYSTCPTGTYQSGITCLSCYIRCSACSGSSTTCTACKSPYLLYNNQCIVNCVSGTSIQVGSACVDCSSNCLYCSGSTSTCTACYTGYVLQGSVCQSSCNSGYTTTTLSPSTCLQCNGCLTCSNSTTTCLTCSNSQYLYNNLCLNTCPTGTFSNGNICNACDVSCITCSGIGACTACSSGYYMYGALCLSICPAGYQSNTNGTCTIIVAPATCSPGCTSTLLSNNLCDSVCNNLACNYDNTMCNPPTSNCGAGLYYNGTACLSCVYPCLTCTSPVACSSCAVSNVNSATLYLYQSSCYSACPSGTLQNGILCTPCSSNCVECYGTNTTCTKCLGTQYLYSGTCVSSCPVGITVPVSTLCEPCNSNCATCSGSVNNCISCTSPAVLMSGVCQSACNPGYTTTSSYPSTCVACTNSCATCSGQTYTCTSCSGGNYLYLSQCVSTCPGPTTVASGGACVSCTSPCAQCSGNSANCTLCISGYSLSGSTCVSTCPSGYEALNGVCTVLCSDGCTHADLLNTTCQSQCNTASCNNDNGYCVTPTVCNTWQYQNQSSCINCVYPCNTCTSATYCLSCKTSTVTLNQLYYFSGTCYDSCPSGTYLSGIVCINCTSPCATCSGNSGYCTSCVSPLKLYNNNCVVACPVGTTIEISGTCYSCSNVCSRCSGTITTCTACPTGTVLSQGTCISECPSGQTTTNSSNGVCLSCTNSCATCQGSTSYCLSCNTGYLLYSNVCISSCPSGYTVVTGSPYVCTPCLSSCLECQTSINNCTACYTGYKVSSSNTCVLATTPSCPDGYTLTATSGTSCLPCTLPCVTCSGSTSYCLSCNAPLIATNGVCSTCTSPCQTCSGLITLCNSCIEGYYLSGTTCLPCNPICNTCSGYSSNCTSCNSSYYFSTNTCIKCISTCLTCATSASQCTSCSTGLLLQNNNCVSCDSSCASCQGLSTTCTSCYAGYYLASSNTCAACSSSCKNCTGSSTYCTACATGKILINNQCGACDPSCASCSINFSTCDTCPSGSVLIAGKCGICSSGCLTCVGDFSTCGSCASSQYLSGGSCYPCPSTCATCSSSSVCLSCVTPYQLFGGSCGLCDPSCAKCSGSNKTCTSCSSSLTLIGTSCLQCTNDCKTCSTTTSQCTSCYNGYYLLGTNCSLCSSNCLTCSLNANNCLSCPIGSDLVSGVCYYTCSSGYLLSGTSCVPCSSTCKTCAGTPGTCTSCYTGFVYQGACVSSCPSGYYYTGTTCSVCSSICSTCSGSPTNCLSCNTGYSLSSSNTCLAICKSGQYYSNNICYNCDSNCLTCSGTSTNCLSCTNSSEIITSSGQCEIPCSVGYTRSSPTNPCQACSSPCLTCDGSTTNCTSCSTGYLYNGNCISSCPANITVSVNNQCLSCQSPCQTCNVSQYTCTTCVSGLYYYYSSCLSVCPSGYKVQDKACVACATADCSNITSNATVIGNQTANYTSSVNASDFTGSPVPFPFTACTTGTTAIMGATKFASPSMRFVASSLPVYAGLAGSSWVFLPSYLSSSGETQHSRRLSTLNPNSGDLILSIVLIIIVIALIFHGICNILCTITFIHKIWNKDQPFIVWRRTHHIASFIVLAFSFVLSFHILRLLYCKMCNKKCFNAQFDRKGHFIEPLIRYGYVGILCTNLPMIAAQILLLNHFQKGYWIWMFALDSMVLTILITLLIIYDIKILEKELLMDEMQQALAPVDNSDRENMDDSMKELIEQFPSVDLRGMKIPENLPKHKIRKNISKSIEDLSTLLPKLKRSNSYPLLDLTGIEIKPEEFKLHTDPQIELDEPYAEEKLILSENSFFNEEANIIQEEIPLIIEEPPKNGEIFNSIPEYKLPNSRLERQVFTPLNLDPRTEEFTEIVAFTEEDSRESIIEEVKGFDDTQQYEETLDPSKSLKKNLEEQEPNMEDLDIIQDLESTIKADSDAEHLGTIEEENEIELEKAITDIKDPELISVPHIETGRRVKLKKDFKGAKIVDLENNIIANLKPVNDQEFDIPKTVVDENDVRYATLTNFNGDKVRVKRNFKGARIVDLEKRIGNPNAFLIGNSVQNENEFQFQTAYPDPEDPEIVVVTHKETGEDVKVRKTFQNAQVVDERGEPLSESEPIDRNDYDIPRTIIDKEDIHLATLSHKFTNARVRVRRDFKGAKIVDLERKTDALNTPIRKYTHVTEKSEPEPLSPDLSDLEFIPFPEEQEWEIPQAKNPSRPKVSAGRERLADLAKIISEESKGMHTPYQQPYVLSGLDSEEEFDYMPEPEIPHYRDLDDDFDQDLDSRADSILDNTDSFGNLGNYGKKKRKKPKKFRPADAFRMKGLEEIYLERQGTKKKPIRNKFTDDMLEPDMEIEDFNPEPPFDSYRTGPLDRAGEEIVRGRNRRQY